MFKYSNQNNKFTLYLTFKNYDTTIKLLCKINNFRNRKSALKGNSAPIYLTVF